MPKQPETEQQRLLRHAAALRKIAARLEATARMIDRRNSPQPEGRW